MSSLALSTICADCPYCGESIELLVSPDEQGDAYIEDCEVCCRPITISVSQSPFSGDISVTLQHENDVAISP